jgi:N6-L-threonylcarbamoyladenine synthase
LTILGIETSCDETSVAVLHGDGSVRSNLIASQIARHQPFGGVVPEIASREHLAHLMPLVQQATAAASIDLRQIEAVAVTAGPGLIGALLVGVAAAQGLGYALGVPLVAVNHLEGHIFSPYLRSDGAAVGRPERFWTVVVSGGHSSVYDVTAGDPPAVRVLNRTRDDAAGEVLDKVAKVLGLPYPGGPEIERHAVGGDSSRYEFPLPRFKDDLPDFSFSGLKSNAIRLARQLALDQTREGPHPLLADFCASFQNSVTGQIVQRLERLWSGTPPELRPTEVGLAGGVAANSDLREKMKVWTAGKGIVLRLAEKVFCTDNAAMIAFAGLQKGRSGLGDPRRVKAFSRGGFSIE